MSMVGQLTDVAVVKRSTASTTGDGEVVLSTPATVSGFERVRCKLSTDDQRRIVANFGSKIEADGLVLFHGPIDIRPKLGSDSPLCDTLVITDHLGNTSTWLVEATRVPSGERHILIAAVRRATFA